ncbi:trypsin-like serine protease [Streptomyces coelicoflavus]|uniref:trypsin-like serine protease n=1 Tax=Streptomyces coelicoflavus TaxID=285562 RepID=UPI0024AD8F82|nr:trypsin-like serine protease [Streptomyces coelicoflavus]MDI6518313.1 trypsin-like serine protease [Streptomyces coelicoflavus]
MTSTPRRARLALPAAGAALALSGAVLAAVPAQASGGAPVPPRPAVTERPATASPAELAHRVRESGAVLKSDTPAAPGAEPDAGPSAEAPSGRIDPKIIGGTNASISEAPWMVQLHYYDDKGTSDTADDEGYFCGGTLVAPAKVLTAAHCVYGLDWAENGAVLAGTAQLPDGSDLHGGRVAGVWRQWVNPTYRPSTISGGDLAVLTLGEALPYKTLRPTTSGDTASYANGTPATVYGWGRTSSTSQDISPTLKKATVPMRSDASCTSYWGSDFVPGQMACAGTPASGQDAGTVSPCNGDSGGPLVVNGRIAGVVSWGVEDCVASGAYGVYAKVSSYVGEVNSRVDDTDLDFDGLADLFARTPGGDAYEYYSLGDRWPYLDNRLSLGDWGGVNLVRQGDLDRDFYQDYVYRASDGVLYTLAFNGVDAYDSIRVGGGWNVMKDLRVPGDLSGDALPDLVAKDKYGVLWLYPGKGDGTFGSRVRIGGGWAKYTITGKGDYNRDGRPDLLARDGSGVLWLYPGTGKAAPALGSPVRVGGGWSVYSAFATAGDVTGDGRPDLLARDGSGVMWLYKGTGKSGTATFKTRVRVGGGWNAFNLFG